jgi:catechol 2,3-dioxygenase-like lactoylglutathione lyase family enzyme
MFDSIGALAVYVTDFERAKQFYTEVLGFTLRVQLTPTLCFLQSQSGSIHVYLQGGHRPASVDRDTARLSFFLQTQDSAARAYAALKAAGVTLLQESPEQVDDNTQCFQFEDPDGNIIEVSGRA